MSEPTVIDAEFEETEVMEITLEDRVKELEGLVKHLLDGRVRVLERLRDTIAAFKEISEESSEE